MDQMEVGQECERVNKKWCRCVKGSAGSGLRVWGQQKEG